MAAAQRFAIHLPGVPEAMKMDGWIGHFDDVGNESWASVKAETHALLDEADAYCREAEIYGTKTAKKRLKFQDGTEINTMMRSHERFFFSIQEAMDLLSFHLINYLQGIAVDTDYVRHELVDAVLAFRRRRIKIKQSPHAYVRSFLISGVSETSLSFWSPEAAVQKQKKDRDFTHGK